MKRFLIKILEKEIRQAFSSSIASSHAVGFNTRNEIIDKAMEMLKVGYEKWQKEFIKKINIK